MSLNKLIHLFSIDTSSFYFPEEEEIHKKLLKLYSLRKKITIWIEKLEENKKVNQPIEYTREKLNAWKKETNNLIKQEKEKLTEILDSHLQDTEPRQLNPNALNDRNVISLFESSLTRALGIKTNELTKSIMVVSVFFFQVFENIVKNGFVYNGDKYVFLTASAGQCRQKKSVFIKESDFKRIEQKIMCGLTVDEINEKGGMTTNKFLAYLALGNSATEPWEDFDIDKAIVVDDFETEVYGEVDYIDEYTYEIKREKRAIKIPHTDGEGFTMDGPTRMFRAPWIKGLLTHFNFHQFIRENCPEGDCTVYDIYGEPHKIIEEDIRYILCRSQFKLHKFYNSFRCYQSRFKTCGCEASYCNMEEDELPKSRINYQMLQTLSDMKDNEIDRLIKQTSKEIEEIGQDYQTTMRLLGAIDYNKNPSYFQQALMIYPELFRDNYCRETLKQTKKSLVKQAKSGRLRVNGIYTFVSCDPYAFFEWLFLGKQNPDGLLDKDEVYCSVYGLDDELACLRSPHLYREWPIKTNKRNEKTDKWLGDTKCIYTSCKSTISRILQFDCDGDKLLVIKDKLLTKIAKRNMQDIVPLAYNLGKADAEKLTPESFYNGMVANFTGGNIGVVSNEISKVWNSENITEEQLNVVKWLTMKNNQVIKTSHLTQ